MIDDDKYPEHAKLNQVRHLSQAIYDFLCWCDDRRITLAEEGQTLGGRPTDELMPLLKSREHLLAEHFEIDLAKLETKKRAMLAAFTAKIET